MKRTLALVLAALFLCLTALGGFAQQKSVLQGSSKEVYYFVDFVSGVEYWVGVYEGFKVAAAQLGVDTVYTGTPEYDLNKELAVYNQVVAKNPAGILACPMVPDAFVDPINNAIDKGIPVMTFATDSPQSKRFAFITSDNVREGYAAADAICKAIGGKGEVAATENPGQLNHEIRVRSFKERIEKNWPNVKVVATFATNQNMDKANTGVHTLLQAHPNVRGIFTPEASSGLGAAQAAFEISHGDIKVICSDINESVLDMIQKGEMFGAIQPNVFIQGYMSMMFLYMAKHQLLNPMNGWKAEGKPWGIYLPFADNGLDVVNKDNAKFFYTKNFLKSLNSRGVEESAQQWVQRAKPKLTFGE
ncbi:MAG TPA: substrate-binding domain-containing protein [Spirochaetia bacterium]|nr:substrate-binding domain-containing protein [Spirochaetia bacterium]